ncbi:MAG TPA: thiolase domain-containing protein [Candidatus Thermoplasmatota archaeon]|nr:thiolase domain-containing protein [Candidatus Thermoplasmatota archaeon]
MSLRDVYVVGVGSTRYGKLAETMREGASQAAIAAIDDARLDPKKIDGGFVSNAFGLVERQGHLGPLIMSALGNPEAPMTTIEAACASGGSAFREAYINVASGFADTMLAVGVEKVSGLDTVTATSYFAYGSDYLYEGACGASFPGLYATIATAHMKKYGTTEEQLAAVAVKNHANGARNPKAHFQKEITIDQVMDSMVVASPLKLYDCCPFSDGAAAAVLTTKEHARELGVDTLVRVAGSGRAGTVAALPDRPDLTTLPSTRLAVRQALKHAGYELSDIDFFEVHDCFTIAEIVATEDLGLFKPGEGAKAAEEGATARDGKHPVNASGGLKAKGHPVGATGIGQVVEVVDQMRGKAGGRQVPKPQVGLTHNIGATGGSAAVHILERCN